jgi:hypothetical protein
MLAPQKKLYAASEALCSAALSLLSVTPEDTLLDLGCGNGVALLLAAQRFGARGALGYEINAERAAETRSAVAAAGLSARIDVRTGNALDASDEDVAGVTCVYLFLIARGLTLVLPLLRRIAARQPERRLRVVSVLYRIPGVLHIRAENVFTGPAIMNPVFLYDLGAEEPEQQQCGAGTLQGPGAEFVSEGEPAATG